MALGYPAKFLFCMFIVHNNIVSFRLILNFKSLFIFKIILYMYILLCCLVIAFWQCTCISICWQLASHEDQRTLEWIGWNQSTTWNSWITVWPCTYNTAFLQKQSCRVPFSLLGPDYMSQFAETTFSPVLYEPTEWSYNY